MQVAGVATMNPLLPVDVVGRQNDQLMDVDAFIESLLATDSVPPLSTELVPAPLARGLGICTDGFLGQQGSNGRQGSKPSQPTTGPGTGPSSTPGVNRSNEVRHNELRGTEAEKLQALYARVRLLEQQQHGGTADLTLDASKQPRLPQPSQQQAPAAPSVLHYSQSQQAIPRSTLFGTTQAQAQQQMQAAYAQQYAQQLAQQQQQQQQQAYMQAAYQQQAQQAQQAAAAAYGQYPAASWGPPNPYGQYPPYYGMQYNMQYAQAMAASMAAAVQSPAVEPPQDLAMPAQTQAVTEAAGSDGEDGDEARAVKRPRLIWTQPLHKRFLEAVEKCGGLDRALPKPIMKEMGVTGLTRENVASHLQKYRQRQKKEDEGHGLDEGDHLDDDDGVAVDGGDGAADAARDKNVGDDETAKVATATAVVNNRAGANEASDDEIKAAGKSTRTTRRNRTKDGKPVATGAVAEAMADALNNSMGNDT